MKKILIVLSIISVLILSFSACDKNEITKIKLSEVTHSIFYAPQYVAINEGFFVDEGLKIELANGLGADKVMTAVLSGQVDIGFAGPEAAIYVYNEGKEDYAKVFAGLTKRDGSFLIGKESPVGFEWKNVVGKSIIGGRKGGVPEMTLEYVLKSKGIIPQEDVNVDTNIQFALMAGAYTSGQGEYVTLFEPTASMIEIEGKGNVLTSIGTDGGEIPYTAYFAKDSYIKNNADAIQRFTNAITKGQLWVDSHTSKEIATSIKPSFPDTDLVLLTKVIERYKSQNTWGTSAVISESSFNHLQEIMESAGQLSKRAPFNKIIYNEFAEKSSKRIK